MVTIKQGITAFLVGMCCSVAYADQYDFAKPEVDLNSTHWEIGMHGGIAVPIGNKSISILANNSAFLNSDPITPGEDEFGENGLSTPDFTAQTLIEGDVQPTGTFGGHAYYRLLPGIAIGIEGSLIFGRSVLITQAGPAFNVPIYAVDYRSNGAQIAPSIRLGGWMGNFRPYVMAGGGPYYLYQEVTAELLDIDDPDHPPVVAAQRNDTYMSTIWGGGIDVNFFNQGSIGLAVQYQRVYMPGNDLQYFIPTMRFDYHF